MSTLTQATQPEVIRGDDIERAAEALDAKLNAPAAVVPMRALVAELALLKSSIERGEQAATDRQHAKGKLTARERISLLLDDGSFCELEALRRHRASGFGMEERRPHTDGVIAGWGTVFGRTVFVYAHDFRIFGGALGEAHAAKIHKLMDMALAAGAPLVSINDGAGARIQEGVTALAGYGGIFRRNVAASGVIPQISVMVGPCAGGAAYSPALTDFVFMVRGISQMFITGPDVVQAVTGERASFDELGGADVHGSVSGVASFVYDDEETCFDEVRYLLSLLPANSKEMPEVIEPGDPVDRSGPLHWRVRFLQYPLGDIRGCARILPGIDQEHGGIIRHGAKLLYAYCNATVPRIQVIVRKAYGGAFIVMDSRSIGADISLAWPTNEIAVMGAEAAANVIFRKEIAAADNPEAVRSARVKEYREELTHPYYAAERGLVDDVIDPRETRTALIHGLRTLRAKQALLPSRKHGNPPQ